MFFGVQESLDCTQPESILLSNKEVSFLPLFHAIKEILRIYITALKHNDLMEEDRVLSKFLYLNLLAADKDHPLNLV